MVAIIGSPSIHPVAFYSGKICGYLTWLLLFLSIFNIYSINVEPIFLLNLISYLLITAGSTLILISLINLGSSTRLGLPIEGTTLKSNGLYKVSRNPMYLGFDFLTIASIMYSSHIAITIMGVYSIVVYHFIILAEEKFLTERFGSAYIAYKQTVRRYL